MRTQISPSGKDNTCCIPYCTALINAQTGCVCVLQWDVEFVRRIWSGLMRESCFSDIIFACNYELNSYIPSVMHIRVCASLCWLSMTSSHTKFSPVSKLRMRILAGWRQQRQRRHLKCSLEKHTTTNIINLLCTRCPRAFACINKWLTLKSRIVSGVTNVECTRKYSFDIIMRIFISSTRSRQKKILIRKLPVVGLCGNCDGIWVNTISTNRFKICPKKLCCLICTSSVVAIQVYGPFYKRFALALQATNRRTPLASVCGVFNARWVRHTRTPVC